MPLLKKGVLLPSKGVDWSIPSTFIDDRSGYPQNMRVLKGEMLKRPGKTAYGSAVADATDIMGLGVIKIGATKHLIRNSQGKMERYNTATSAWVSIAATDFTGGDDDFFFYSTIEESSFGIITNGLDKIRKWTGSGNASVLGGSPPLAKYSCYLSPYLLLGYITSGGNVFPSKIQWPDTGAPETWSGGNSGSRVLSDEPSDIQNIVKLNEYAAVYKKDSLWLGRKVQSTDIFQFDPMLTGIGLAAPRAVVDAEGKHYFMAFNDFYVWNGVRAESIGAPIREHVFGSLQRDVMNRSFAIHVQELYEVWFFVITSGNSWPQEVWKYNYSSGFWYYDTCLNLTASRKWEKITDVTWNDLSGTWNQQIGSWNASTLTAKWEEIVFGNTSGVTSILDYTTTNDLGLAVSAVHETKDFIADTLDRKERWLQFRCWVKGTNGGKLYVDYSTDRGSNWTNIPYNSSQAYITLTTALAKVDMWLDIVAEHVRFRLRNAESNEIFYVQNYYPYYLKKEGSADFRAA